MFYCYLIFHLNEFEKAVQYLNTVNDHFNTVTNVNKLLSEFNYQNSLRKGMVINLDDSLIKLMKFPNRMEDYLALIILELALLPIISKKIAPSLSEEIYNFVNILILVGKFYYERDCKIQLK